ncbi:MAG: CBS domain-containing protein [Candidatus Rokubacteria bacterium]|nr:CBS domain-containing protein [Candidatus Rokubacteria bacterium]
MTISCITAPPETPVLEARQMMLEKRIRHLLVVDGTTLMGIVTDRDIRLNLPSPATSLSVWEINYLLARMTVSNVMSKNVATIDPARDAKEAAQLMLDRKIGALPVVSNGRQLVGIITETDLLRAFVKSG